MSTCEARVILGRHAAVVGRPTGGQRVGEVRQLDERAGDDVLVSAIGVQRVRGVADLQTVCLGLGLGLVNGWGAHGADWGRVGTQCGHARSQRTRKP